MASDSPLQFSGCDLESRTEEADRLVRSGFAFLPGVAVLAVGGYGRRELFPYSDVDLLILLSEEALLEQVKEPLSALLRQLWDAQFRASQSVHTFAECLRLEENNIELTIALLDQRLLISDAADYPQFQTAFQNFLGRRQREIASRLARLTEERHQKFQNTVFHLEPNVKDGPGGLRDVHFLRWLSQLGIRTDSAAEYGDEARAVAEMRCELHRFSGRDNNILNFEAQEHLAEKWHTTPAEVMANYYRVARALQRATLYALDMVEAKKSPFLTRMRTLSSRMSSGEFAVVNGMISFRGQSPRGADKDLVLSLLELVARHGWRLSAELGRWIHAARAALAKSLHGEWHAFQNILLLPHANRALREMHANGLLTVLFPEFGSIEGLVLRDFFHRYTVDEHTLVAIDGLASLREKQTPFAGLIREMEDPSLLVMALLFHDVGKSAETENHSAASSALAGAALQRIGMPEGEQETVLFLIQAHLDLSTVMNTRDISDPATARAVAVHVGTSERLRLLTLLTYLDSSAVHPTAMTEWRSSLLWQLFTATDRELIRELQTERIPSETTDTQVHREFLEGLPVRYRRTHTRADVEKHIAMSRQGTAVSLEKTERAWVLTLVTRDHSFLFASVAGTISSFGMDILKAEAFGNARGTVIEIFYFTDPLRTLELNPSEAEHMRSVVRDAALGQVNVNQLLAKRPKRLFRGVREHLPFRTSFNQEISNDATLIEVVAEDRPRLLYDLASAISCEKCNIESVLINTEARRAIDVFYVTEQGKKLTPETMEKIQTQLDTSLRELQ